MCPRKTRATGSNARSATGRWSDTSYKRAWYLVEAMNRHGTDALEANRGGKAGGCGELARLGIDAFEANRENGGRDRRDR